jgi:hypothetical protein
VGSERQRRFSAMRVTPIKLRTDVRFSGGTASPIESIFSDSAAESMKSCEGYPLAGSAAQKRSHFALALS